MQLARKVDFLSDLTSNLVCVRYFTFSVKAGSQIIQIPRGKSPFVDAPPNAYAYVASKDHRAPPSDRGSRVYFNGIKLNIDQAKHLLSKKDKPIHISTTLDSFNMLCMHRNAEWAVLSRLVTSPIRQQGVFPLYPGDTVETFI